MRYTSIVAAGCLTLLLASPPGARAANDPASAPVPGVLLASAEVPLAKPDGKKDHEKKDHEKKDKKDHDRDRDRDKDHDRTGHQIPWPNDDPRDDCGPDTPAPTPEPGTLLLFGAAAGAMGLRRRLRGRDR